MDPSAFRKAIHLRPDSEQGATKKGCRSVICISRNSTDILKVNSSFNAFEFLSFAFPYCSDDGNWVNSVSATLGSDDFANATGNTDKEFWIVDENVALIPSTLFKESEQESNFELLFGKTKNLNLNRQELPNAEAFGVFRCPKLLESQLGRAPKNAYLCWLNEFISRSTSKFNTSIILQDNQFALTVAKEGKLKFSNWFVRTKPEDVLYFLMATLESLNILHAEVSLELGGDIKKGDDVFTTLSRFIAKMTFASRPKNLTYGYSFSTLPAHQTPFILAAACA